MEISIKIITTLLFLLIFSTVVYAEDFGYPICCQYAEDGQLELVKKCIANGLDVHNRLDGSGVTILMVASATGQFEIVKYLVSKGADVNDLSRHGNTVLSYAIDNEHIDIVNLLIDNNAKVTINDLKKACKQNNNKLIKYLESKYNKQK